MPEETGAPGLVERTIAEWKDRPGPLLPILQAVQEGLGCVPEQVVPQIAKALNLSRAEVHGVVSFYHDFRREAGGRHVLRVCRAESCQAMGSDALEAALKQALGIDYHQTTADGNFTLEPVYCLGQCACSPALMIDGEVHARLSAEDVPALLAEYREQGA